MQESITRVALKTTKRINNIIVKSDERFKPYLVLDFKELQNIANKNVQLHRRAII
jgi:hypothetical protein